MRSLLFPLLVFPLFLTPSCGGEVTRGVQAQPSADGECDLTKPFGAPMLVDGLNEGSEPKSHPSLTPDELTVFFGVDATGITARMYTATRGTRDAPFSKPTQVPGLSPGGNYPIISGDGLTIYFGNPHLDQASGAFRCPLYSASRTRIEDPFSNPGPVGDMACSDAFMSADAQDLYFQAGTNDAPVMSRLRWDGSNFSQLDTPIITTADDQNCRPHGCHPVVSADDRTLFFERATAETPNGSIWSATRAKPTGPFHSPAPMTEFTAAASDLSAPTVEWPSTDGCRLYLTITTVVSGVATRGIYVAARGR